MQLLLKSALFSLLMFTFSGCAFFNKNITVEANNLAARDDMQSAVVVVLALDNINATTVWETVAGDYSSVRYNGNMKAFVRRMEEPFGSVVVLLGPPNSYLLSSLHFVRGNVNYRFSMPTSGKNVLSIRASKPSRAYFMGSYRFDQDGEEFDLTPNKTYSELGAMQQAKDMLKDTPFAEVVDRRIAQLQR